MNINIPIKWAVVGAVSFLLILGVFMSWHSDPNNGYAQYTNGSAATAAVFDVPSLVGKDINDVQAILGISTEDNSNHVWPNGDDEHLKTWQKAKVDLAVNFHSQNNQVIDFFIGTDDLSGTTSDKERLFALGNLKEGDPRYRIDIQPAGGHPNEYTGVKAIPN